MQEAKFWPLVWEDPLEEEMATHSRILPGESPRKEEPGGLQSMGSQRMGYDLVTKQQTTTRGHTGWDWALIQWLVYLKRGKLDTDRHTGMEKEMATHSSVLAWRIPGTGEPGGLPSMGSQSRTQLKRLSSSSSNRHRGKTSCDNRGDWSDVATSQGIPRIHSNGQKTQRGRERFSPRALRESAVLRTPWFWTSSLQNWERINLCSFKPPSFREFVTVSIRN